MILHAICILATAQEVDATYTDEERGFSVLLPQGWSATRAKDVNRHLVLHAPADARSGATLVLAVREPMKAVFDGQLTLDAFLDEVKKQYPKKFADFEFVKAEKGREGENPTLTLVYRYTSAGQKIGQLQHLVWSRGQHWSLSWGCLDAVFEQNRELFERGSKSFRVKKPG
jgi:hypothetical protein